MIIPNHRSTTSICCRSVPPHFGIKLQATNTNWSGFHPGREAEEPKETTLFAATYSSLKICYRRIQANQAQEIYHSEDIDSYYTIYCSKMCLATQRWKTWYQGTACANSALIEISNKLQTCMLKTHLNNIWTTVSLQPSHSWPLPLTCNIFSFNFSPTGRMLCIALHRKSLI